MFQVFQLTSDGEEQSLGYFPTFEDAAAAACELSEWRPYAVIDVQEVSK
jgi:hypothetical protein